jgi:hypothetical protein
MGAILGTFWPKAAIDTLAAIHHNILLKTMELALPQKPQPYYFGGNCSLG